ncbi:MAG TPA: AbrB/MazE/SpoVT family DNA-binding domain-containing protein [Candidatus Woesearchaeota archaeon]|nr:AbrB/MazE/SpoVT family DNA-binding domain-containing protein [Candidatus Woesearchaeota archaeon]
MKKVYISYIVIGMKRSIMLLGGKTLVISLPARWAKDNNLRKGQEVDIHNNDGLLYISPNTLRDFSSLDIDIRDKKNKSLILKMIFSAYIRGYDEINVRFKNKEQLDLIYSMAYTLIGFATMRQDKNVITLKDLSEINLDEFDNVYPKIYLMLKEVIKEGIDALELGDFEKLGNFSQRDFTINQYVNFCLRSILKSNVMGSNKRIFYYSKLTNLEQLGDAFINFFEFVAKERIFLDKNEKQCFKKIRDRINELGKVIYKPNVDNITKLFEETKEIVYFASEIQNPAIRINIIWLCTSLNNLLESALPGCFEA